VAIKMDVAHAVCQLPPSTSWPRSLGFSFVLPGTPLHPDNSLVPKATSALGDPKASRMSTSRCVALLVAILHLVRALPANISEAPPSGLRGAVGVAGGARPVLRQQSNGDSCSTGGPGVPEDFARFANTSITIKAPASTIWSFLIDMEHWAKWNDVFSVRIEGAPELELGKHFMISSYFATAPWGLRRTTLRFNLTAMEQDTRLCWEALGVPGLSARHCYAFCNVEGGTLLYNYEDHSGLLEDIVRRTMGQATTDGFARFNYFLRNQSESAAMTKFAGPDSPH